MGQIHSGFGLDALGIDGYDGTVAEHPDEIEGIDPKIEKSPSAEVRTHDPFLVAHAVTQGCGNQARIADTTLADQIPDHFHGRLISCPYSLCQKHLTAFGKVDYGPGLIQVGHECLFHEAGQAFPDGLSGNVEMVRMGRSYIYQIHIRIFQHFRVGPIGFFHIPPCGESLGFFFGARGDRVATESMHPVEGDGRLFSDPSGSGDADLEISVIHNCWRLCHFIMYSMARSSWLSRFSFARRSRSRSSSMSGIMPTPS